jgi:hypothetical protein
MKTDNELLQKILDALWIIIYIICFFAGILIGTIINAIK